MHRFFGIASLALVACFSSTNPVDDAGSDAGTGADTSPPDTSKPVVEAGTETWQDGKTIDADVVIPSGATVTIAPGANITVGSNVSIRVEARWSARARRELTRRSRAACGKASKWPCTEA